MTSAVVEGIRGYTAYTRQKKAYTLDCGKKNAGIRLGTLGRTQTYARIPAFYKCSNAYTRIFHLGETTILFNLLDSFDDTRIERVAVERG